MGMITHITTAAAPQPLGHYVQASEYEGMLFVSGQLAVRPDGTHTVGADFEAQTLQALTNVLAIVKAAGGSPGSILKITAYIVGVENWSTLNRVYREVLGEARPARSVVPVPTLHHGYLIELDAVAVCGNGSMFRGRQNGE
jgi:2-iminobutanoate/2-iminopropanoate deaminase